MDDKKANQLIEITSMISEMVENGQINDYKYHYNEETNTLDISFIPIKKTEFIKVDFTITPTGAEF